MSYWSKISSDVEVPHTALADQMWSAPTPNYQLRQVAAAGDKQYHRISKMPYVVPKGNPWKVQEFRSRQEVVRGKPEFKAAAYRTRAYRDAIEAEKAKDDYRKIKNYYDSITPGGSSGSHLVESVTQTDSHGVLYHQPPEVRIMQQDRPFFQTGTQETQTDPPQAPSVRSFGVQHVNPVVLTNTAAVQSQVIAFEGGTQTDAEEIPIRVSVGVGNANPRFYDRKLLEFNAAHKRGIEDDEENSPPKRLKKPDVSDAFPILTAQKRKMEDDDEPNAFGKRRRLAPEDPPEEERLEAIAPPMDLEGALDDRPAPGPVRRMKVYRGPAHRFDPYLRKASQFAGKPFMTPFNEETVDAPRGTKRGFPEDEPPFGPPPKKQRMDDEEEMYLQPLAALIRRRPAKGKGRARPAIAGNAAEDNFVVEESVVPPRVGPEVRPLAKAAARYNIDQAEVAIPARPQVWEPPTVEIRKRPRKGQMVDTRPPKRQKLRR